jgi:hypothetical protein
MHSFTRALILGLSLCLVYALVVSFYHPAGIVALLTIPHWDGDHYLSIASRGYYLYPCGEELERTGFTLCGNPWFPGWAYWNNVISWVLHVSIRDAFAYSAACFAVLAIAFSANASSCLLTQPDIGVHQRKFSEPILCSLFALLQPAGFYLFTHFPYAFVITLSWAYLSVFYGTTHRLKSLFLAPLAVAISLAYPTGALVCLFPAVSTLARGVADGRLARSSRQVIGLVLPFCAGTLIVSAIFEARFDDFWLYFRHSAQFRHGESLLPMVFDWGSVRRRELAVSAWYAGGIFLFWRSGVFRIETIVYLLALIVVSLITGPMHSIHRYLLLLFPLGAWVAYSDRPAWLKWSWLSMAVALHFLVFLPRYLEGRLI